MRAFGTMVALLILAGCDRYGDSSIGETNRSEWRIDDGLCPGSEGGCAMTVPVAAGIELSVDADVLCAHPRRDASGRTVTDCDLMGFDVDVTGAAEPRATSYAASEGRLDLRVFTTSPGVVDFDLRRSGAPYDHMTMEVREAVALECGKVGAGGASWDMRSLSLDASYAVELFGADAEEDVELGCRLLDENGAPLFSAAAIEWQVLEGADLVTIDDGGLFGGDASTGARIYVRLGSRSGTVRLEARFETLTRELELVLG